MLIKYHYKDRVFRFSEESLTSEENIFTVIVGKNGTGKSRLMKSVIENFIGRSGKNGTIGNTLFSQEPMFNNIEVVTPPKNIIAVSTSPFDKFPLDINERLPEKYTYLGLRTLRSTDLGMAYMAKIYISLLKSVIRSSEKMEKISQVLDYLGYSPRILARYHLEFSVNRVREILVSEDPIDSFIQQYLTNPLNSLTRIRLKNFFVDNKKIDILKIERVLDIYSRFDHEMFKPRLEVLLNEDGVFFGPNNQYREDDLFFLADMGLAKLRDITLEKNNGQTFRIGDASSGEQSVVMSILGIASQICDDSLICIDEPEVCLHPEWQEKYIDLLINTFKSFKRCHFLIATHSPLMVSRLSDTNCYLMNMEDGELTLASKINRKSVDYQLANTFGTPGYKNEYLTRELISLLAVFSETGNINSETRDKLRTLLSLKEQISDSDPVKKLMKMAQEALMASS